MRELTGGKGVEVTFDGVGRDTWDTSLNATARRGLIVSYGNASGPVAPFAPGILGPKGSLYVTRQTLFTHITSRERTQSMAEDLFAVVEAGQVKVRIDQRFALTEVQQAHVSLEARATTAGDMSACADTCSRQFTGRSSMAVCSSSRRFRTLAGGTST